MFPHQFQQSTGAQSIFYTEMHAIAVFKLLLNKLNSSLTNEMSIFCDGQSVFESIYKQNERELYPILANKYRELITKHDIVIHK